jgi:hypothetical protein
MIALYGWKHGEIPYTAISRKTTPQFSRDSDLHYWRRDHKDPSATLHRPENIDTVYIYSAQDWEAQVDKKFIVFSVMTGASVTAIQGALGHGHLHPEMLQNVDPIIVPQVMVTTTGSSTR